MLSHYGITYAINHSRIIITNTSKCGESLSSRTLKSTSEPSLPSLVQYSLDITHMITCFVLLKQMSFMHNFHHVKLSVQTSPRYPQSCFSCAQTQNPISPTVDSEILIDSIPVHDSRIAMIMHPWNLEVLATVGIAIFLR